MSAYLGYKEASALLGLTVRTLRSYQHLGKLPKPDIWLGGSPGWKPSTLERWRDTRGDKRVVHAPIDWSRRPIDPSGIDF